MVSDKADIDIDDLDGNFKSCFARSMVLNSSQRRSAKSALFKQLHKEENVEIASPERILDAPVVTNLRKECLILEESRRCNVPGSNNSSRRGSLCSSRISETPVENIVYQSQIDTLQWQMKQVKASRDMYKAVMKQVVTFLEKTHRSLDVLSTRLNETSTVSRSRSEYQVSSISSSNLDTLNECTKKSTATRDYSSFRDFTWRRQKKQELYVDEIPPEKLSQEAFRLLRTAQSILNTEEPDLAQMNGLPPEDLDFMAQLAREFPRVRESKPVQSFSLSPKLLKPEEIKTSTALKRNLSFRHKTTKPALDHTLESTLIFENSCIMSSTTIDEKSIQEKIKYEKSSSPPASNVGSTEDESGFSSMNSYQEIGLPLPPGYEELRRMDSLTKSKEARKTYMKEDLRSIDEIKLWQKPEQASHRRWHSTPVEVNDNQPMKVLWV